MTPRVVLDTGVFVAAVARRGPGSVAILSAWRVGTFDVVVSAPLLVEMERVLDRLDVVPREEIEDLLRHIRTAAVMVTPSEAITDCRDSGDNMVLEAAVAGNAQYIVTFDDDLWKMSPYRGIQIVTVRDFLRKTGIRPRRGRKLQG